MTSITWLESLIIEVSFLGLSHCRSNLPKTVLLRRNPARAYPFRDYVELVARCHLSVLLVTMSARTGRSARNKNLWSRAPEIEFATTPDKSVYRKLAFGRRREDFQFPIIPFTRTWHNHRMGFVGHKEASAHPMGVELTESWPPTIQRRIGRRSIRPRRRTR